MNYGFDSQSPEWNEERKEQLAEAFADYFGIPIRHTPKSAYIEVDGLYPGVRVRNLKHIIPDIVSEDEFVEVAEDIYNEVMSIEHEEEDYIHGDDVLPELGDEDEEPGEDEVDDDGGDADALERLHEEIDAEPDEGGDDESDAENAVEDETDATEDAVPDEVSDAGQTDGHDIEPYDPNVPSLKDSIETAGDIIE